MPETPFTPAQLALERTGLEFLRNGKFRKARDAFKALNKSQPARALPLLIEANLGLANEMMSKGLVSEANQVLAYLKSIAPASQNLTLTPVAAENSRDAWSSMVPLAAQRLASSSEPAGEIRAADEMILGATSPDHPGHPDAEAILTALELGYGSAATAQTTSLLRSVPRSSPFSHWVLFFKGMTALESGDHARAADCFRRVPENSLLHPSIAALLSICGTAATTQPTPRTVRALCAWAGHPALAEPLLLAEPHWRKKQRSKAFAVFTKKIPGLFCQGARSFNADLTRFLTSRFVHTHLDDSAYSDTLLDYIAFESRTHARTAMDQAFFSIDFDSYSGCAHRHFRTALGKLEAISSVAPLSPAMLSRVFRNLAEIYIDAVKKDPEDACSGPNAKKALEHAIKHDPDNLRAWLTQCDLLSMGMDSSAYHRFVDDLTKRFPEHKEVLIRNGDCCLGRKVYTKALRNFERAAVIDSVDPRIGCGILRSHLGIAEELYKKRKRSKVDWEFIDSLAAPHMAGNEFPLWRLRVQRIGLEVRYAMTEEGLVALVAAAQLVSPNPFLLEAACRFSPIKFKLNLKDEVLEKMFPSRPAPESLADFLAVIDEAETFADSALYASASVVASKIFTAHQAELLRFSAERKNLTTLLIKIFNRASIDLAPVSAAIHDWFLRDPSDPLLRLLCASYSFPWLRSPPHEDLSELAAQLRATADPDNHTLLRLIVSAVERFGVGYGGSLRQEKPKLDLNYDPHEGDEFFDDYDGDDDESFGNELAEIDKVMGKMSPAQLIAALGKIMGGAGIPSPGNFIDSFISPPPTKPPQKRPASGPRQRTDLGRGNHPTT